MRNEASEALVECKKHNDVQCGHFMLGIKPGEDMPTQLQLPYWWISTQ